MKPTPKQLTHALRCIRYTYNMSLSDAIVFWKNMSKKAQETWYGE